MVPLLNMEEVDSLPEVKATYLLFYNFACIENADNYGPLPYQDIKTNKQERPLTYDNLETIYNTAEANIDSIVQNVMSTLRLIVQLGTSRRFRRFLLLIQSVVYKHRILTQTLMS